MRIALAQLNPTVGDLAGNRRLVEEAAAKAASERADLLVAPEMVLTGYPPMDLLERDGYVRDQLRELDALAPASRQVAIAHGAVLPGEQHEQLVQQTRHQREQQEPVGDRALPRRLARGALGVDVDPARVTRGAAEKLDAVVRDRHPLGHAELGALVIGRRRHRRDHERLRHSRRR